MAKRKTTQQRKKQQKPQSVNARKGALGVRPRAVLDKHALAYARLLEDPCRADLTYPVYSAGTAGYLTRVKQVVLLGGNSGAADGYTAFVPGGDADVTDMYGMWHHGWSAGGGALGVIAGATGPSFLRSTAVGSYRPIAGCLKVHYTGSELNRAGMISVGIVNQLQLAAGETILNPITAFVPSSAKTVRLGSEPHEVRWVPTNATDQAFSSSTQPAAGGTFSFSTVVYVMAQGVPPGTCSVECDFVYEWQPDTTQGMEHTVEAPRSANTLADVLRVLGEAYGGLTAFATSSAGNTVLGVVGRGLYAAMNAKGVPLRAG